VERVYQQKAINSAYLTRRSYLEDKEREVLFTSIVDSSLLNIVEHYIPAPAFLNTQLFFDPYNPHQPNYWHRDIQYGQSDEVQKKAITQGDIMPHFRIPIVDETGLELIPGSHKRWDTDNEYNTRMALHGRKPSDNLANAKAISLKRGDVLVFSAKMLHRGKYGHQRFAFDVLFANEQSSYLNSVSKDCLPSHDMPDSIRRHPVYVRSIKS
jgi:ectoine hydroxylase-related dioxygenase (phytanoyl-CoA dioxygenase family)